VTLDAVAFAVPPPAGVVERLVGAAVASRIAAGDTTVWPAAARPGWAAAARGARPLVGEIEGLRERLRIAGLTRVVLAAAGGVGVAAEVLADLDPRLIVLDGTDPVQVADALAGDLDATVLVVSAPPGEDTAAVELLWDTLATAFRGEGLDPDERTVLVTAPDGPLLARAGEVTTVLGPPDVDGPWAALTAFALVPAGLAGADVGVLLADALDTAPALAGDRPDNPALVVGALLAQAPLVAVTGAGPLAEWVAQLLAGGLGKDGRGPLPVLVEAPGAPGWAAPGVLTVAVDGAGPADVTTDGPAAAQVVLWLHATAVAAHLLAVDPTDRPDAHTATAAEVPPAFADGVVDVHAGDWLPTGTDTVAAALRALLDSADPHTTHLAVHAYLDRHDDASAAVLRPELTRRTGLVTTFGWAPRCLPGPGQREKGGPAGGVICQLTGSGADGDHHLGDLQITQARADAAALADRGRRVLRLHLTDRVVGLVTLVRAVQQL
jgi:glucose-6-phosphate isomerase